MDTVRTRFAPSPTGFMHVGNLRTALYAWLLARSGKGKFILRIEDTDRTRYVPGAVDIIYNTLASAGLTHDEGPDVGGPVGPYIQSERQGMYLQYAEELAKKGAAYYCFCDKKEESEEPIEEEETAPKACPHGCGGGCENLSYEEAITKVKAGAPYVIRQRIPSDGVTSFSDGVYGDISIENKVLDDQVLIKRDGMPTYNFANVIDDHLMGITHVVRGCEYLSSTPKYNLLYQAFGWDIPQYVHLPLIMGRDAEGNVSKLSKRHGSVSFENLVAEGYLPEAIVNYIALLGWSPKNDNEIFPLSELAEIFNVSGLNKASAVFDYAKLRWMNTEYIRKTSLEDFTTMACKFAQLEGTALEGAWSKIAAILHQRTELLSEIPEKISFLVKLPDFELDLFNNKKSKCDPAAALEILKEVVPQFTALADWTPENIGSIISAYAEKYEVKLGKPMWAVRIAVSGCSVTPGGPSEIMDILGKEESLKRLALAMDRLSVI